MSQENERKRIVGGATKQNSSTKQNCTTGSHSAVAWGHRSGRDRASGLTSRSFSFNMTSQLASGSLAACVCLRSQSGHWVPGDALDPALPASPYQHSLPRRKRPLTPLSSRAQALPAHRYRALWTSPALRIGPLRTSGARPAPEVPRVRSIDDCFVDAHRIRCPSAFDLGHRDPPLCSTASRSSARRA